MLESPETLSPVPDLTYEPHVIHSHASIDISNGCTEKN